MGRTWKEIPRKWLGFKLLKSTAAAQRWLLVLFCPNLTGSFGRSRPPQISEHGPEFAQGSGENKTGNDQTVTYKYFNSHVLGNSGHQASSSFSPLRRLAHEFGRGSGTLLVSQGQPRLSRCPQTQQRQVCWFIFINTLTEVRIRRHRSGHACGHASWPRIRKRGRW